MKYISRPLIKSLAKIKHAFFRAEREYIDGDYLIKDPKRVLIVSTTAIGDTLFALPGLNALKQLAPKATLDLAVRDKVYPLVKRLKLVDDFLIYKGHYRNAFGLYKKIRAKNYDICLVFHDSDPCLVELCYLANVPRIFRIGFKDQKCAPYLTKRVPYKPGTHAIVQRLNMLETVFDISLSNKIQPTMRLPVDSDEAQGFWFQLMSERGINKELKRVGLQLGASGAYKEWPIEKNLEFARRILNVENFLLVLIGGPGDRKKAGKLKRLLKSDGILDLVGKIELSKLPEVISGLDCLVTPDTGPLHIAISVKTPTVSLFVPTSILETGPIQDLEIHKVVHENPPCNPCRGKYCKSHGCMSLIEPETVFNQVVAILEK